MSSLFHVLRYTASLAGPVVDGDRGTYLDPSLLFWAFVNGRDTVMGTAPSQETTR
jgi:hypothetical protein